MSGAPHFGRLRWRCRRGLLELDLVLERFWLRHGGKLTARQALELEQILLLEESDLWEILSGRRDHEDPQLAGMVKLLRQV